MKKNIITISLLSVLFCNCSTAQKNLNNDYYRIDNYIDLQVKLSRDTISFSDTIFVVVTYSNKSDTSFYFRPNALLSLNRELHGAFVFDINFTFLSQYSNINNLVLINSHGTYSETYSVIIERPWCLPGKNELFVMYQFRAIKEQKRDFEILYGGLISPPFEIYVKEK